MREVYSFTQEDGVPLDSKIDSRTCPDAYIALIRWRMKRSGRSFMNDHAHAATGAVRATLQWRDGDDNARSDLNDACRRVGIRAESCR